MFSATWTDILGIYVKWQGHTTSFDTLLESRVPPAKESAVDNAADAIDVDMFAVAINRHHPESFEHLNRLCCIQLYQDCTSCEHQAVHK